MELPYRTDSLRASRAVSRRIRTSPSRIGPATLRVMILPRSRPARTRTFTWVASPAMPVRPINSTTSAGEPFSSAMDDSGGTPLLLQGRIGERELLEKPLRLAGLDDRDAGGGLRETGGLAQPALLGNVEVRDPLLLAEHRDVGEDLDRVDVLG